MTNDDKAKLAFSDAVYRIMKKRHDFEATIFQSHRDLAQRKGSADPFVSGSMLEMGLLADPASDQFRQARLDLVEAVRHCWYRVNPDLQAAVFSAVRDFAIQKDENVDDAHSAAIGVLENARASGEALAELQAELAVKRAKEDREKAEKDRVRAITLLEGEGYVTGS